MAKPLLDDAKKIAAIDKEGMLTFYLDLAKHYREAATLAETVEISYHNPASVIVAGMGGSAIGGDLLKDWAKNKTCVPIEVCREYHLPAYADEKTLVFVASYSGDTEESLSAFLDAVKRKCMVFCVSSGGALLEYAEKLKVPYLRVPGGMAPRAALPYMFIPLLLCLEKTGLASNVSEELLEAFGVLEKISRENSVEKPVKENFAKTLAQSIDKTVPIVYGFGVYRGVAERCKQQFNENSKVPAKWEVFSELNHNEIVGWENANELGGCFSAIFIRDKHEPVEIKSRIDVTIEIMSKTGPKMFEVQSQGRSELAKMLSVICIGDLVSIYLAVLHNVDPTPVKIISYLKAALEKSGVKKKILDELAKLA